MELFFDSLLILPLQLLFEINWELFLDSHSILPLELLFDTVNRVVKGVRESGKSDTF